MASKKKKAIVPSYVVGDVGVNPLVADLPIPADTAEATIRHLLIRGYDQPAALSYAKAAKSWCNRDDEGWVLWSGVISLLSEPKPEPVV